MFCSKIGVDRPNGINKAAFSVDGAGSEIYVFYSVL